MKLSDLGEFKILTNVLLPRAFELGGYVGADCAVVPLGNEHNLVISSDKGNTPLVWSLPDYVVEYQDMGWLTAIAGISDLATNGAVPICATNNLVAPPDFSVKRIDEFSIGFCDALASYGFNHAGGDLSEGSAFSTSSTFIGSTKQIDFSGQMAQRAVSGRVVVLGELGTFAAAYCTAQKYGFENLPEKARRLLCRPTVPYDAMRNLSAEKLYKFATDASDGIHTALSLLANRSGSEISVDLSEITFDPMVVSTARDLGVSEETIGFAWGNWQQVIMIADEHWEQFEFHVGKTDYQSIGKFRNGTKEILYYKHGEPVEIKPPTNEGFRSSSYVATGRLPFL